VAAEVMVIRALAPGPSSPSWRRRRDLTDLVVLAGVKEDSFGRRGLAGVNVRHDPNIADLVQGDIASGHFQNFL